MLPAPPAACELGGDGTPTGAYWERMFGNPDSCTSADRLAAVYACTQVISTSIAGMPLQLFRNDGETRKRETKHWVAGLLKDAPNQAMTWSTYRTALLVSTILRGDGYSRNFWKGGRPEELFPLPPKAVTPKLTDQRRMIYEIGQNDVKVPAGTFSRPDIAHFKALSEDGLRGINPIEHCRVTMGGAVALANYGRKSALEGAPLRGIITANTDFKNPDTARRVRQSWNEAYSAALAGNGIAIFEGGDMKWSQINMSMRDAQFIESMGFSVDEICRIFNVPPHKIQKLDRATFNNIEHLSFEFYTGTLVPWIIRVEEVMNQTLLTEADRKAGLCLRHNADGLLRGDLASRSDSYQKQIGSGVMTPNEGRRLEDREPLEGGDQLLFPVNFVPLAQLGEAVATPPADPVPSPDPNPPTPTK
ncbi:MAG: phage portal protein family [Akkermansiaceae bacterium]|nr:phage portal protein family [Akkermansiaceae bacterium]